MQYGLIGEHLGHSFSREVHAHLGNYPYELRELAPDEVAGFMQAREFSAINVTIPYKETVIPYLDEIDEAAAAIGAVNTVRREGERLLGFNTDFAGLSDLVRRTGVDLCGRSVLVLGSGGTSKTAVAVARAMGAREVIVVSRTPEAGQVSYEEAYRRFPHAEFLVNATPVGMYPKQDASPIDLSRFPRLCGVVDAIYKPLRTDLVLAARARGIPAEGGLYMLVAQGIHASEIFFQKDISPEMADKVFRAVQSEKENVFLIGMPGCGKSTVGIALAKALDRPFFDTDTLISQHTGMAISDIFREKGEAGFRDIEEEVIRELALHTRGAVIATGGGAILRAANLHAMRRVGRIYFLDRALDNILPTPDRPLSMDREALAARYRERYPLYTAAADVILAPDEDCAHRVEMIRKDFLAL